MHGKNILSICLKLLKSLVEEQAVNFHGRQVAAVGWLTFFNMLDVFLGFPEPLFIGQQLVFYNILYLHWLPLLIRGNCTH